MMTLETLPACIHTASRYTATTSERFAPISTAVTIQPLIDTGWGITSFARKGVRGVERDAYAKHVVRLAHPDLQPIAGHRCEIIATNGNAGDSAFNLMAGIYRQVCSNGLVVGSRLASIRIIHTGDAGAIHKQLSDAVHTIAGEFPALRETVEHWQNLPTQEHERARFGKLAQAIRTGKHVSEIEYSFSDAIANTSRRSEDDSHSLWNVFNRAQENTLRGMGGRHRGITGIDSQLRINRQLWDLADATSDGKLLTVYDLAHTMSVSDALKQARTN